ncbi:hypothetical protein TSUD_194100 [Trifolium subterraneum]|uniref:Uncharacterized protein n=1 Tax=Trifolium subterraneum TaxID=3900 RepID=A0A2Z6NUR5_TRISU|nr:hypothetical protein TSUD_194100 [Trifolium subterraneum]
MIWFSRYQSRAPVKRSVATGSLLKPSKQDPLKEDGRSGKTVTRTSGSSSSHKDLQIRAPDGRHTGTIISSSVSANGNSILGSTKVLAPSARFAFDGSGYGSMAEVGAAKSSLLKNDGKDIADFTRGSSSRVVHSHRHENTAISKSSDEIQKLIERYGRERSVERILERGGKRSFNRLPDKAKDESSKDDRNKLRYNDASIEKCHTEGRFHGQTFPPPPHLYPNMIPQSVGAGRCDEYADRRNGASRLSPRYEEKELRRSEETDFAG